MIKKLILVLLCHFSCNYLSAQIDENQNIVAEKLLEKLKILTTKDTARFNLLILYSDALQYTDNAESVKSAKEALQLAKELNYRQGIVQAYRHLGALYLPKSDFTTSLDYAQKAIKEAIDIGDTITAQVIENNIAQIYAMMGDFEHAIPGFKKFYRAALHLGNEKSIAMAVNNIALCYLNLENLDSANLYLEQVIHYGEKLKDDQLLAYGYTNMGGLLDKKGQYKEAQKNFELALRLAEENNFTEIIIQANTGLSEANFYLNNYEEASRFALQGIEMSKKAGVVQNQYEGYKLLTDIYKSQNKFKEALEAYQNFIILSDSMRVEGKKQIVIERKEQEFKRQIDRAYSDAKIKETEMRNQYLFMLIAIIVVTFFISFLFYKRQRDARQIQKETALTLQISETELKALRSQMNPHFLNNAFISIQEFLRENKPDEAEKYLIQFSKLMRAVLNCSDKKEIPLSQDLQILEWYMQFENLRLDLPFIYHIDIDEKIDIENTYVPPLILQPMVENAIKHGLMPKQATGNIYIIIEQIEDTIHAIVEDDGVGRNLNKKVTEPMLKNHQSMGMKITRERLNILNAMKNIHADLKIIDLTKDNKPSGTRVELTLPYQA
ncbi:MAG: histidine kinase [Bacteroidia bacterium]|nr:histidine kinase [Bacteroidia bacterium]